MKALAALAAVLLVSCSSLQKPSCTQAQFDELVSSYESAVNAAIDAGRCDAYEKVEACPAYEAATSAFMANFYAVCGR